MFRWISSNSCPLNLLLVRSQQAEIIIAKRLIQGRNNVTRVRVEPRSFDQSRRKKRRLYLFSHTADEDGPKVSVQLLNFFVRFELSCSALYVTS